MRGARMHDVHGSWIPALGLIAGTEGGGDYKKTLQLMVVCISKFSTCAAVC